MRNFITLENVLLVFWGVWVVVEGVAEEGVGEEGVVVEVVGVDADETFSNFSFNLGATMDNTNASIEIYV